MMLSDAQGPKMLADRSEIHPSLWASLNGGCDVITHAVSGALFAVPLAGGVLVAINSRLARPEVEYILNHSEARVFFVDSDLLDALDGIGESAPALEVVVQVDDPTVTQSHDRRAAADLTYAEVRGTAYSGESLPWQAIVSHPAVVDAAVVGVADEKWCERPRAFVTLRAGASVTDEELTAHVRSQLDRGLVLALDLAVRPPPGLEGRQGQGVARDVRATRASRASAQTLLFW